jgi:ubiquinone/menaquinone biosynthesis C-methylase UbiE
MNAIMSQFKQPHGLLGRLIGHVMAVENRERIEWTVNLLAVQPTDHILDIGFGPGISTKLLAAQATKGLVAGIDISDVMVQQARGRNAAEVRQGRVELQQGTVEKLPYPDSMFDKVLVINSLHHWGDKQAGLREIRRVLKPSGLIAIVEQPPSKVTVESEMIQRGDELQTILSQAGFTDLEPIYASLKRGMCVLLRGRK